jgi:hypothetical protein
MKRCFVWIDPYPVQPDISSGNPVTGQLCLVSTRLAGSLISTLASPLSRQGRIPQATEEEEEEEEGVILTLPFANVFCASRRISRCGF